MIKKYIFILLLASFTVSGCGNNGKSADDTVSTTEPVAVVAKSDNAAAGKTVKITKADFLHKIMDYEANPKTWQYKGDKPCLIDFYADWCGPCKIAAPVLDELAAIYKDQIIIYKVDTEVERELASVFGIRSIPSFLFCPAEGMPTMSNGIARTPEETKQMFIQMIDELLLGKEKAEATL